MSSGQLLFKSYDQTEEERRQQSRNLGLLIQKEIDDQAPISGTEEVINVFMLASAIPIARLLKQRAEQSR
jgi:hypothetical protein